MKGGTRHLRNIDRIAAAFGLSYADQLVIAGKNADCVTSLSGYQMTGYGCPGSAEARQS